MVNPLQPASLSQARRADGPVSTPAPPSAPPSAPEPRDILISRNVQDETVFPATQETLHNVTVNGGQLSDAKVELNATLNPAKDGTYVFPQSDQADQTAALVFSATTDTIHSFEAHGIPINYNSPDGKLQTTPDEGQDFNAFYSRDPQPGTHFFDGLDTKTNQKIMSGASGEVVSHETGHSILDTLRPAYLSSYTPDVAAFHEAWGDWCGLLKSFDDPRTIDLVAKQTGGDLSKPNAIAYTGEELGKAINDVEGKNVTGGPYVRDAINNFTWIDPNTLPGDAPPDQLSSEAHSFSRLWTGSMYEILEKIEQRNMAACNGDAKAALQATGAQAWSITKNLISFMPQGDFTYADMAKALIASDKADNGGKNADIMQSVMSARGILRPAASTPAPPPTSAPPTNGGSVFEMASMKSMTADGPKPLSDLVRPVTTRLSGERFGMFSGAVVSTLVDKDGSLAQDAETTQRLKDSVANLIAQGRIRYNDPTYKMKMPQDYFDAKGRPYVGYVRWEGDQMVLERSKVLD